MCGLAGQVSFHTDLTTRPELAAAMTATMALRGPDDEGVWVSPHAVLCHRRLAVIDLAGGRQPMVNNPHDDCSPVLAYTGEVYNYRELRAELRARGHRFRTDSDTEVVLRSYVEWGAACAERLNGMFAFAVWDPRLDELLLVRDRFGIKPLYYYPTPDGVLFGSEPKAILANPAARAVVTADGLREIFAIVQTPEHAVFDGMYEVRPGHVVRVNRAGLTRHRYWELTAHEHPDDLDTTIATVRDLLTDIADRQLHADVPVGTLLSGGLDSSAITALAQRVHPEPLPAFSVDFTGHTDRFAAQGVWADPDTPFAVEVAEHVGAEHVVVMLDNEDLLEEDVRLATLRAHDLPVATGDMDFSLLLLCRALRERLTVALSGEASDELFGGYPWFHDPAAVGADTFPWHVPFERGGGIGALRAVGLWDSLDLTDYVKQRYAEAVAEVPVLAGESATEARMREVTYLNLTRWETFLLDRKDRISMAAGLEVRVPFCDHRLVEYVFNVPWAMKSFDGREKSLLRAAMRGVLPDSVLDRGKSPYPSTQDLAYVRALRARVEAVLTDDAPVLAIVPPDRVRRLLDAPAATYATGGPWSARSVLERLVEFNTWVGEYQVRVDSH